jgi:hypothetical protein
MIYGERGKGGMGERDGRNVGKLSYFTMVG